jgi:hypothetical protein
MPVEEGADIEKLARTLAVFTPDALLAPNTGGAKVLR